MSDWRSLLRPVPSTFFEKASEVEDARFIFFGASLDATASYRSGSRLAPHAVRSASKYMESYSVRTGLDWDDLSLADLGDIADVEEVDTAVKSIEEVARGIHELGKTPVMLGGEHTVTLGALRAIKPDALIVFDAHLDLRDELFDEKLCHATYLRRAHEEQGFKAAVIAARALSREEIEYAEAHGILVITAQELRGGLGEAEDKLRSLLAGTGSVYVSVDIDAVDPREAPAVGNPSPEGISTSQLLDLIRVVAEFNVTGFDLTEVSPAYDSGNTAALAAYIVLESLYAFK